MTASQLIESLPIAFTIIAGIALVFSVAFVTWLVLKDTDYKYFERSINEDNL